MGRMMGIKKREDINISHQAILQAAPRCFAEMIKIRNVFINTYFMQSILRLESQECVGTGRFISYCVQVSQRINLRKAVVLITVSYFVCPSSPSTLKVQSTRTRHKYCHCWYYNGCYSLSPNMLEFAWALLELKQYVSECHSRWYCIFAILHLS